MFYLQFYSCLQGQVVLRKWAVRRGARTCLKNQKVTGLPMKLQSIQGTVYLNNILV